MQSTSGAATTITQHQGDILPPPNRVAQFSPAQLSVGDCDCDVM